MENKNDSKVNKLQHINSLDTIRGFAVIVVLMHHGSYGLFKGGWIGVDIFFVLSGFLITTILFKENNVNGNISISNFYYRRVLRLFPALIIGLVIAYFLWDYSNFQAPADKVKATFAAAFYYLNLIPQNTTGNIAHLWSLSIEEQFYLFWPLSLILILKMEMKKQLYLLLFLTIIVMIFRIFVYNSSLFPNEGFFVINSSRFTFCRIDSLLMGAFLSILFINKLYKINIKNYITTLYFSILLFVFFLIFFFVDQSNAFYNNGGFILTNLLCFITVFLAINTPNHNFFSNKVVNWFGLRSYGIYIYHFPIFLVLEQFRVPHDLFNLLLVTFFRVVITLIVAELSFKFIEKPILKLKK